MEHHRAERPAGSTGPAGPPGGDTRPALSTELCNKILLPGAAPIAVMTLSVPAGNWVGHISMHAGPLGPCGGGSPDEGKSYTGDYNCWLEVGGGGWGGGHPASSRLHEFRTLAWSTPLPWLETASTVTVQCQLFDVAQDRGATLSVGSFVVTPVAGVQHQ